MSNGVTQLNCIGSWGRWANQCFQWIFGSCYSRRHGTTLQVPPWIGEKIYGFASERPDRKLNVFEEKMDHGKEDARIPNLKEPLRFADFAGYFQYHTSYYLPDKAWIQDTFETPVPELRDRIRTPAMIGYFGGCDDVAGLHIRHGDYGQQAFYRTPPRWYHEQLEKINPSSIFIATDDRNAVKEFARWNPVTTEDLGIPRVIDAAVLNSRSFRDCNALEKNDTALDFFPDWYLLQQCNTLLIPNSTFGFTAAWTSKKNNRTFRSNPEIQGFHPIDPWDAMPMQFVKQENYQHIDGLYLKSNPAWGR